MAANALQAVLDKASREATPVPAAAEPAAPAPAPKPRSQGRPRAAAAPKASADREKFYRPVRDGRRFVGAHFDPEVAKQLRMIAVEDDTTIQALLEEAVDLLFVKKGKSKIATLMNP